MAARAAAVASLVLLLGSYVSAAFIRGGYGNTHWSQFNEFPCTDLLSQCQSLASSGLCSYPVVTQQCMMSCKMCKSGSTGFGHVAGVKPWQHGVSTAAVFGMVGQQQQPTASIARRLLQQSALTPAAQHGWADAPYSYQILGGNLNSRRSWPAKKYSAVGVTHWTATTTGCKDIAAKCVVLAQAGKCQKVPNFMNKYCQQSCKACKGTGIKGYSSRSLNTAIKNIRDASL